MCKEQPQANMQAMQEKTSSLQESTNIMQIQIHDQVDENYLVKTSGVNAITLYDTGAKMNYMS